jgi:hypothetical protein
MFKASDSDWETYGFLRFEKFSDKVTYCNQEEFGGGNRGDWYYCDDDTLRVYFGTFSDSHSPGASYYTYADSYETQAAYDAVKADWEKTEEFLPRDDEDEEEDDEENEEFVKLEDAIEMVLAAARKAEVDIENREKLTEAINTVEDYFTNHVFEE